MTLVAKHCSVIWLNTHIDNEINNNLLSKSKSELNFCLIFVFKCEVREDWSVNWYNCYSFCLWLILYNNCTLLKQSNRLFCWILNFALSLGIFFVRPDCFLVRSSLVSDLTNDLLMKKKIICSLVMENVKFSYHFVDNKLQINYGWYNRKLRKYFNETLCTGMSLRFQVAA